MYFRSAVKRLLAGTMDGIAALALIAGAIAGALITWAFIAPRLSAARANVQQLSEQLARTERDLLERCAAAERALEQERMQYRDALEERTQRIEHLLQECSRLTAEANTLRQRLEEDRSYREELQHQLRIEFENIASRILDERSTALKQQNTEALEKLLAPLRERISTFEQKVERVYTEHTRGTAALQEQLNHLFQLNTRLTEQADSLVTALRGDKRLQGSWGEVQLERLLELSGLQRDVEYQVQVSTRVGEGERIRPDVIIHLPEGKHLVIDAKVSLSAYLAMIEATDDAERDRWLRQHVAAVRQHIERLSSKNYFSADGIHSPEFVLLFMPIEAALSVALQADRELFSLAWDRRIVLTSPTTLLATLRTVASVWKHERHNRTALEIAEEAGKLYDKLASVLNDLVKVGETLERARRDYDDALRRLSSGAGNVIARAQRLVELGAKASKQISRSLLEQARGDE
ncbi:MAG: DNA recombination protein RmuC [Bacteroidota bacterium]|nr:DNA recombination protein RmuC [Bacteroidota bacterium]